MVIEACHLAEIRVRARFNRPDSVSESVTSTPSSSVSLSWYEARNVLARLMGTFRHPDGKTVAPPWVQSAAIAPTMRFISRPLLVTCANTGHPLEVVPPYIATILPAALGPSAFATSAPSGAIATPPNAHTAGTSATAYTRIRF